jgi:glutathionyl-hydroquinone reductase
MNRSVNGFLRFTVPVLWDKKNHTIVNNESAEIIRLLNTEFNDLLPADKAKIDIYPSELREEIDSVNEWVYTTINSPSLSSRVFEPLTESRLDGVYKAGFASTTEAYEAAVYALFEALDKVEKTLEGKEFLVDNQLTEADIRLWVTIVRPRTAFFLLRLFLGCLMLIFGANLSRFALIRSMLDTLNATSAISGMGIRTSTGLLVRARAV